MNDGYRRTVELLLDIAPRVFAEPDFALKGGTAINLFVWDMPRLSVDLDVVFTPADVPRDDALARIATALDRIRQALERSAGTTVRLAAAKGDEVKLQVERSGYRVKVEVNTVFRGTAYPVVSRALAPAAADHFKRDVRIGVLDPDELFGSKLVAAMDRQHPRDLFDVMQLFDRGGITPRMRRAFVVYAAGHPRPIGELLTPNPQPLEQPYRTDFVGMTEHAVPLDRLLATRDRLFRELPESLDGDERRFLLSMKEGEPAWALLDIPQVERLPALTWKLLNVRKLRDDHPEKHARMLSTLRAKLQL